MGFRAHVVNEGWTDAQLLYVVEETGEGKVFTLTIGAGGKLERSEPLETDAGVEGKAKPMMRLPGPLARSVFPAIVEALSANGFERAAESTLRGRCEAMDAHLQDLRHMLKLNERTLAVREGSR
jgi:hypothetical protein